MDKKPPIYLLDYRLEWSIYKELNDRLVKDSGPTPRHGNRILWKMMRDKQILCWFDPLIEDDMCIGELLPKDRDILLIKNYE